MKNNNLSNKKRYLLTKRVFLVKVKVLLQGIGSHKVEVERVRSHEKKVSFFI